MVETGRTARAAHPNYILTSSEIVLLLTHSGNVSAKAEFMLFTSFTLFQVDLDSLGSAQETEGKKQTKQCLKMMPYRNNLIISRLIFIDVEVIRYS